MNFKSSIQKQRRKKLKHDRLYEIQCVKRGLIQEGCHVNVSRLVGRWFRRKGFRVSETGIYTYRVYAK